MVNKEHIVELINRRLNRVLLIAQTALPEKQFSAFRKLFLDEFGKSGLQRDLERVIGNWPHQDRQG